MAENQKWFANKGQVIQTSIALAGFLVATKNAWADLRNSAYLSLGAVVFYLLTALVIISITRLIREIRSTGSAQKPTGLAIHAALYGTQGKYFELHEKLQQKVVGDTLDTIARFPDDPNPIQPKLLMVLYSYAQSEPQFIALREGDHLTISKQRAGTSSLTIQDLLIANAEFTRLTDGVNLLQDKLKTEGQRTATAEKELDDCKKENQQVVDGLHESIDRLMEDLRIRNIQLEEALKDLGRQRLFDRGGKYQFESFSWLVEIRYFDLADTELADYVRNVFEKSSWRTHIVRSEEHVPRVGPGQPRILASAVDELNGEVAIEIVKIFTEARLIKEPGGLVLGKPASLLRGTEITHVFNPQSMEIEPVGASGSADFFVEIFPRKRDAELGFSSTTSS